jgi:putative nucleotidyltransferase with HDIG domain
MTSRDGLSCLVVDDEPRLRRVLVQLLELDGFRCREAGTGAQGLQAMEAEPAPLVISDLRMPEMDGVTLLGHVVKRWPDTAVLMVSAVADVDIAVKCLQLGALDYVSKPFNLEEVRARVKQALERRQLRLELKSYQRSLEERVQVQAHRIEELFLGGVQALAQALEAKDAYLRGHSLRVSEYAVSIARSVGLDDNAIDDIALGGHLHDIGKIGVSEEVLHKAGKLTDAEYRHIMEHTVIGARILGPLLRDAPMVIAVVRSHHERLDGKGLPDGLAGDTIPMAARIVSVADAFDAMTSERPYRHSLSVDRALLELRTQRGIQWDPVAVDGFLAAHPDPARLPILTPDLPAGPPPPSVG